MTLMLRIPGTTRTIKASCPFGVFAHVAAASILTTASIKPFATARALSGNVAKIELLSMVSLSQTLCEGVHWGESLWSAPWQ
ncbi:hypothetical protein [Pseudacidobacterium ailaaui]|jgi:hypothetical protein|uniref:hypothetical protein n=1 Tax=Pseudacidobacterium ailaaui TaxID=1382359 RepID=UPI00138E1E7A|nr:hypothetical protein [Pseudacidobacterium ailaaui]